MPCRLPLLLLPLSALFLVVLLAVYPPLLWLRSYFSGTFCKRLANVALERFANLIAPPSGFFFRIPSPRSQVSGRPRYLLSTWVHLTLGLGSTSGSPGFTCQLPGFPLVGLAIRSDHSSNHLENAGRDLLAEL